MARHGPWQANEEIKNDQSPIVLLAILAIEAPAAFAQTVTDQELASARALCHEQSHIEPPPPPQAPGAPLVRRGYKAEWKSCEGIDAEFNKRQAARDADETAKQAGVKALLDRLAK
jgi:hypothetical protein